MFSQRRKVNPQQFADGLIDFAQTGNRRPLSPGIIRNNTITFVIAMALPVGLVVLAAWWAQQINGDSLTENFAKFGYALIALDIAGHIGHNLFHLLAEGKAVIFTALALFGQEVHGVSPALLDTSAIQILQYVLLALGAIGSLYTAYRIAKQNYGEGRAWVTFAPYAVPIAILTAMNVWLFVLPMAMRM